MLQQSPVKVTGQSPKRVPSLQSKALKFSTIDQCYCCLDFESFPCFALPSSVKMSKHDGYAPFVITSSKPCLVWNSWRSSSYAKSHQSMTTETLSPQSTQHRISRTEKAFPDTQTTTPSYPSARIARQTSSPAIYHQDTRIHEFVKQIQHTRDCQRTSSIKKSRTTMANDWRFRMNDKATGPETQNETPIFTE